MNPVPGGVVDVKLNMADEVFRRTLTQFSTMSPSFFPIKLKEKSYPVVGCSFSHTSFLLDYYYLDPSSVSLVSKLIYRCGYTHHGKCHFPW